MDLGTYQKILIAALSLKPIEPLHIGNLSEKRLPRATAMCTLSILFFSRSLILAFCTGHLRGLKANANVDGLGISTCLGERFRPLLHPFSSAAEVEMLWAAHSMNPTCPR